MTDVEAKPVIKVATILFSVVLGLVVIAIGAASFVPGGGQGRAKTAPDQNAATQPAATQPTAGRALGSTKRGLVIDSSDVERALESPELPTSRPQRLLPGTKMMVIDSSRSLKGLLEESGPVVPPATQPATQPATRPAQP